MCQEFIQEWKRIVADSKVQGVKAYDARLVALMRVYEVDTILTFNAADFQRYEASIPPTLPLCSLNLPSEFPIIGTD